VTAWRPEAFRVVLRSDRAMTLARAYRDEVRRFLRLGWRHLLWVYLLSLAFLFVRGLLAYLCVRFLGIHAGSLQSIVQIQMGMAFVVLFAPTPGGAGVTESVSRALMADIVPIGLVPYYNLVWRFSTTYLVAIAGLLCVSRALLEHGRQVGAARP
jgi:glycosyltransferase 2 family protein